MAESILFNIAGEIISKLGSLAFRHSKLGSVKDELEKLKRTVSTVQAVLLYAEEQSSQTHQIKVWIESLKEVFYDADDLLDELSADSLRLQVMTGNKMAMELRRCFSSSNKFAYDFKMGRKIKDIRDRLDGIIANRRFHLEERQVEAQPQIMVREREQTHSSVPEVVVGREDDKEAIVELFLSINYEESVAIIPIVGIGGLGKTTLTQLVYNDERVKTHFEIMIWVCISDNFDVKLIVEKILESIHGERYRDFEMDTLKNRLRQNIDGKKYLLVLDDVWIDNVERWSRLRDLLVVGARGSRIIVTTRLRKAAEIVSTSPLYELKGLLKGESWSLFKQMAFKRGEVPSSSHERVGKEIVAKCVGVPLAIKTVGRLLYFKNTEEEWVCFKDKDLSEIDEKDNDILQTLKLSYNHLPSHMKLCFSYCRLYPKGSTIRVDTLIQQWIAQGFIESSYSGQCFEDIGMEYFHDLYWRSFFQEVERDWLGNITSCKMHDFMHDLAMSVAGSDCIILNSNMQNVDGGTRHVSFNFNLNSPWQFSDSLLNAQKLRTFILSENLRCEMAKGQCHAIFSNFPRLRVLDLSSLGVEILPYSIGKLKHLRYLNLADNKGIEMLPDSITQLQKLQVLKMTRCVQLKQLPKDIHKLVNLRHLKIWRCDGLTHMPRGLGQLTSLQNLPTFILARDNNMSKNSGGLGELCDLNDLRESLRILNLRYVKNAASEFEAANLKAKQYLQALVLRWKQSGGDDDGPNNVDSENDETSLEELQPHQNLKWLIVDGCGRLNFPCWVSSLHNLVDLQIHNCKKCQRFPPLDQFPSLKRLSIAKLADLEYIENDMSGVALFFPSLEKLWLSNCPNLKGWLSCRSYASTAEWLSFHCLSYLDIEACPNLTSMPLISSVKELILTNASEKLLRDILKTKILGSQSNSSSPSSSLSPVPSQLKKLVIQKIEDPEFLQEELLQKLTSLQSLHICYCPGVTTLSHVMQHLATLHTLVIKSCEKLDFSDDEQNSGAIQWQFLGSLRTLDLENIPKLTYLPRGLQFVTTLQTIWIISCPILASLPEWMGNFVALQHLIIDKCPQLSERCNSNIAVDWPKIAHIPFIKIDGVVIQQNGNYQL